MKTPIILIGPMFSGKSTIANLLANQLDLPRHSMDAYRWQNITMRSKQPKVYPVWHVIGHPFRLMLSSAS